MSEMRKKIHIINGKNLIFTRFILKGLMKLAQNGLCLWKKV